ncbi:hypothetical protein SLA2020_047730 [Shorea laevis]
MKDFGGAFAMLSDSRKMNVKPVAGMYNAIMAGYFREKKISAGLRVLKQMELDSVKPDPQTYSYLIGYCDREEDIIKYYEELKCSGITVTKHIFMSLINAYAACGQFEKAKQVLLDEGIPVKTLNELRSALVSSLASNGQMADVLDTYEEIKQSVGDLEPRAVLSLMECLHSERYLNLMLQLLEELNDQGYWIEAKGLQNSLLIWKEYEIAGLPYNVFNFLRMYQLLLACGDHKSAEAMRTKIPKDDPDVRDVIRAFQVTYPKSTTPAKANKRPQQQENK